MTLLNARAREARAQAFRAAPMYTYICPDEAERVRAVRELWDALIRFTLIYGQVRTTPEMSGMACWLAPGNTAIGFRRAATGRRVCWR